MRGPVVAGSLIGSVLEDRSVKDELRRISLRIRSWRDEAGLTLQELAGKSGVSASTIHKIENSQTVPTISVLLKVAHGLRRRPSELFEGDRPERKAALTRREERDVLQTRKGALLRRVVAGIPDASIDVWQVTHEPGHGSRPEPDAPRLHYRGELIILVEEGSLHVDVADESYELAPGDTLHFKTSEHHVWENRGDGPMSAYFFGLLPRAARKVS
jgi:transcriptional regulator with XRE-family HTH domain